MPMARQAPFLILSLAVVAVQGLCSATLLLPEESQAAVEGASLKNQMDSIFTGAIQQDQPGLAVLVKKDGKVLFEKGYGVRDLRSHASNTPETNFRLASVTKQFTAMAIMLLIHDGKLHYEDHLTDAVPDFPAYGKPITIRHLLTHTGGLPDYEELMAKEEHTNGKHWSPEHQIQDDEALRLLKAAAVAKFAPGTSWAYSNSGYVVLGAVVAKASGLSYGEFLHRRLFAPLQMNNSVVYELGRNEVPQRAYGHSKEKGVFIETDQSATSATRGDGRIYSSIADMSKWDEGLQKHTLLTEKEMAQGLIPVKLADGSQPRWPSAPERDSDNLAPGEPVSYGFGWFLDPYKSHPRMWHTGGTMGFRTVIERFFGDRVTIVILCNRTDLDPKELAEKVGDLVFSGP